LLRAAARWRSPLAFAVGLPDRWGVNKHHTINYIEFGVTDMAAAQSFYASAFDWQFSDYGPDYAGIRGNDGEVGGFRKEAEVARGGPLVVLFSADLDASVQRVKDAGGEITAEPFAFPGGRRFHFIDPSGNELAVWAE
jgi:predicted enzyme related to lactoylglutathione lyase